MTCRNLNLKARTDRRFVRSTYRSNRFVLAEIKAPHAHTDEARPRPSVNLAFVLDRSGSMSGEKIRLAKLAVEQSVARLKADDRFSIVVYDNYIDVVFESEFATPDAKQRAMSALNRSTRVARPTSARAGFAAVSRSPVSWPPTVSIGAFF